MKKYFICLLLVVLQFTIMSQQNIIIDKKDFATDQSKGLSEAMKNIKYGDFYFKKNIPFGYQQAYQYYIKAYEYNNNNTALNYKIAVSIILGLLHYDALPYIEKAYNQNNLLTDDIEFFYARALQISGKFKDAIAFYDEYEKKTINNRKDVSKYIIECQNGELLRRSPRVVAINNLSTINSPYKDYCTMLTSDGRTMYFTSRRPAVYGKIDPDDNMYYEDIYMTTKDSNGWTEPVYVKDLNTPFHDDVVGLSHDGNTLIIYRDGDLFYSEKQGNKWTSLKAFPKTINSKEVESSACFSPDGNTLYFVRGKNVDNPEKSNGDIYFSRKDARGNWSEAIKLANINSPYDEDGVFMLADGKTLYFSSKGHNSIGGYDIFVTKLQDNGEFSQPINLGYPINSAYDDIYFVMEPSKIKGYFSSIRNDSQGLMDIYEVLFIENAIKHNTEDNLIACFHTSTSETAMEAMALIVVSGKIIDFNSNKPIDAEIIIIDNNTNEVVYRTKSNSQTGEYVITIPTGKNYGMTIRKDGYLYYSENFDLVAHIQKQEIQKDITLQTIDKGKTTALRNIFFDFGSSNLKPSSIAELNNIVEFLKTNSNLNIEISGHTDNIGSLERNIELSQQRADVVRDYIVRQGIESHRIQTKGYGYLQPIADNSTEQGRQKNRRVEMKIIE